MIFWIPSVYIFNGYTKIKISLFQMNILSPILYLTPYLLARQLFLENKIYYLDLNILTVIYSHCYALYFD